MQRCPSQIISNLSFVPKPVKKGPIIEVSMVALPPKLKSGIRSNKEK